MNLKEFLGAVRVYWKSFTAVTAAVLALGLAWLVLAPLQYVSHAQLLVSVGGSATANAYQNDGVVASRVNSYVALLTSDAASQRVVDKLGSPLSAKEMAATITAVQVPNTAIIDIAAAAPSAEQARLVAQTVADEFVGYVAAIETPTGEDAQKVAVTVVSAATEPQSRLVEKIAIGVVIAVIAGLLGAAAVWLRSTTDPVIRTPRRAAAVAGAPVLGTVTVGSADAEVEAEGYQRLARRLARPESNVGKVIQLVSAVPGVDPVQVARGLRGAIEASGQTCAVIDAVTTGNAASPGPNILVYRPWTSSSPERSKPRATRALFEKLRQEFDQVLVATDGSDSASAALTEFSDSAVVLLGTEGSTKRLLADSARVLRDAGVVGRGLVLVVRGAGMHS